MLMLGIEPGSSLQERISLQCL
ncbi:rCG44443 [Rattus norvegicus]|uniref:RCG44443 n=1 Tax=Rattus norvegicus TaxID=10116 RepID=A6I4Z3_RAT|nr:rCG44443 [Rattus norvegicus]